MFYVGLDAHFRQSTFCVLDGRGRKILTRTVKGPWSEIVKELAKIREPFVVCFEASTGYGCLYEQLQNVARHVVVAHPGQLRLIFRSTRKNDRVDAEKLAKLLFLDEVPSVHVPTCEVRSWRRMINHRHTLVNERVRVKNNLRAMLRTHSIDAPKGLWKLKGLGWLENVELPSEMDALQRDLLLQRLHSLTDMIERVEHVLNRTSRQNPGVSLLKTIPGVGPRTAEAVVAWVDDPRRFARVKSIGRYFGVVPSQDASGSFNRLGHITREGPATVRWLLAEAAWQSIRRSARVREVYERVERGDPDRRKTALVATAHYLLRVMLTMLKTGEVWRIESKAA